MNSDPIARESPADALRATMRGPVLAPGDPGYDAARRVWNGSINKNPALVARCTGVADAIAALHMKSNPQHDIYHLSSGNDSQTFRELTTALAAEACWVVDARLPGSPRRAC